MTKQGACLCALRSPEDELEILITRRAFWNHAANRPMSYPGEWVIPGGLSEDEDSNLLETAVREFKEELKYSGPITKTRLIKRGWYHGNKNYVNFYAAKIDERYKMEVIEEGEVIAFQWITPADALRLIYSEDFTRDQMQEFENHGLGNSAFGDYAAYERHFPVTSIEALQFIQSSHELRREY